MFYKFIVKFVKSCFQSLGNHEFSYGVVELIPFIENLACPVLATNIVLNNTPELAKLSNLKKSIVTTISGYKIGIIGYITPETKLMSIKNNVDFNEEIESIKKEVLNLQNQDVKIIIALGHSGYTKDKEIAKEVEGLDLVIGGHSHSLLWNDDYPETEIIDGPYPTYVSQSSGKKVPVVQAYAFSKYLGKLLLKFNSEGDLISSSGYPIILNSSISEDTEVLRIVEEYKANLETLQSKVIGSTLVKLNQQSCYSQECNLGNLIADSMVYKFNKQYPNEVSTDVPIAIIQAGGIRASIDRPVPTNITIGDLFNIFPFGENLTAVAVKGYEIIQMLEHSVARLYIAEYTNEFLHFSGLKVEYNLNKRQNSIKNIYIRCCGDRVYSKLSKEKLYKVVMPKFLSTGGDGFTVFSKLPSTVLNFNIVDSLIDYISDNSPIHPSVEGRIVQYFTKNL